ncbi:MAG TPA: histidine--tRNA ligase [Candidatus Saccharimonadales bacterium]
MPLPTQPYKGARDFYPEDKRIQKYMFSKLRSSVEAFGYEEYDAPMLEPLDIYLAKSGSELVNDQTYTFTDRGDRQVVIRPEMTPSVSRMVAAKRNQLNFPLRWYSIPNLWRYERPQRGRYREHWQLNVDLFGEASIAAEEEIISLASSVLKSFGATNDMFEVRLNSRKLMEYLAKTYLSLEDVKALALFKLIDRKNKIDEQAFNEQAMELIGNQELVDKLASFLEISDISNVPEELKDAEGISELKTLIAHLASNPEIGKVVFDPNIMRGFDYYNDIVFEVFDTHPENNRAMMGGGRYDGLVELFGVEPVPTIGFGLGDATLLNFLQVHELLPDIKAETDLAVLLLDDEFGNSQSLVNALRSQGLNVAVDFSSRKIGNKIRWAESRGIKHISVIGQNEIDSQKLSIKNLDDGYEELIELNAVGQYLKN